MEQSGTLPICPASREDGRPPQIGRFSHTPAALDGADAAPKGSVKRMTSTGRIQRVGGQLLEIHHHRVRRQRHADSLTRARLRPFRPKRGLPDNHCSNLGWPVRNEWPVRWKRRRWDRIENGPPLSKRGQRAGGTKFVVGWKTPPLNLWEVKPQRFLRSAAAAGDATVCAHFAVAGFRVEVAEKQI